MSERMHRTQVFLPPDLNRALDELARQQGATKAELIRRAASRLDGEETSLEQDPIWGVVGLGARSGGSASGEHDRYLLEAELAGWKRQPG